MKDPGVLRLVDLELHAFALFYKLFDSLWDVVLSCEYIVGAKKINTFPTTS